MENEVQKKILVPIDGSDRAVNTLKYIARNNVFHGMHIVLFNVFSAVPESYWDLENSAASRAIAKQVHAWELSQKKLIQDHMERAKGILEKAGIPSASIETKIQKRKKGIARDIIREAQNGYDAVVSRRRGTTTLRGIVLGSVATKLVSNIVFTPLILVGKKPANKKILMGFDGSKDAMRAIDFVGSTLAGFDYQVELFHVIRGAESKLSEMPQTGASNAFIKAAKKELGSSFDLARKKLVKAGFASKLISTKIVSNMNSRAQAIADEARLHDFGTIMMGRKGRSHVRGFFIGRVTNKVIHLARERTVWVIR